MKQERCLHSCVECRRAAVWECYGGNENYCNAVKKKMLQVRFPELCPKHLKDFSLNLWVRAYLSETSRASFSLKTLVSIYALRGFALDITLMRPPTPQGVLDAINDKD